MSSDRQLNYVNNLQNRDQNLYYVDDASELNSINLEENDKIYAINDNKLFQMEIVDQEEELSGSIISFNGRNNTKIKSLVANIEPKQDLHGYDHPWPSGGGKNLFDLSTVASSVYGMTITVNEKTVTIDGTSNSSGRATIAVFRFSTTGTYHLHTSGDLLWLKNWSSLGTDATVTVNDTSVAYRLVTATLTSGTTYHLTATDNQIESSNSFTGYAPYSNECPISGRTGMTVTRTGKNLFSFNNVATKTVYRANMKPIGDSVNDVYLSGAQGASDNQQLIVASWAYCRLKIGDTAVKEDTILTLSCKVINYTVDCSGYVVLGYINNSNTQVVLDRFNFSDIGTYTVTLTGTIPSGCFPVITATPANKSTNFTLTQYAEIHDIQLELGSTATAYEPYTGTTLPISWETEAGTVYGGTLDVTTGELTVDRAYALLNDPDLWIESSGTQDFIYNVNYSDRKQYSSSYQGIICSSFPVDSSAMAYMRWTGIISYKVGVKNNTTSYTLVDIQAMAEADKIAIVYELATPIEYQLTPQEVTTLLGTNNIWMDTGPTTLKISEKGITAFELKPYN